MLFITYFNILFEHTIGVGANTFLLLCRAENNWIHVQVAAFLNVLLPGGLIKSSFLPTEKFNTNSIYNFIAEQVSSTADVCPNAKTVWY
jgi:hypothetical protein